MIDRTLTRRRLLLTGAAAAGAALLDRSVVWAQANRRVKFIVDSQVNVWKGGKPPANRIQRPFLATDLLAEMSKNGVARAVIVPVSWDGEETPAAAAKEYPDRFRVFSIYNLENLAALDDPAVVAKRPGVAGLRLFLRDPKSAAWVTSPASASFWQTVERDGIPVMFFPSDPAALRKITEAYPKAKLCIDSLGAIQEKRGLAAFEGEYDAVLALAKFPNVSIKVSQLPLYSGQAFPFKNMEPVIRLVYDAFGPERMFWGSDITALEPLRVTYEQCITSFTEQAWLTDKDLDLIMGQAFCKWANWPMPA